MAKGGYERKDPVVYAAQRRELGVRVREGQAIRVAARFLNIPYSTASLWAAQDGLRRADRAADAAGEARPPMGDWARPGRGCALAALAAEEESLPPADYPELKGLKGRVRLTKLSELSAFHRMRAVAAIEEGCIGLAMTSLREAQRLQRAWRTLRDWLEIHPEPYEAPAQGWREEWDELMRAEEEGREPVFKPRTPEQQARDAIRNEIYKAIDDARDAERLAYHAGRELTEEEVSEDRLFTLSDDIACADRLMAEREKWMSLPGRAPPPLVVHLPPRRWPDPADLVRRRREEEARAAEAEAERQAKAGQAAPEKYGIKDAFPVIYRGRRI